MIQTNRKQEALQKRSFQVQLTVKTIKDEAMQVIIKTTHHLALATNYRTEHKPGTKKLVKRV